MEREMIPFGPRWHCIEALTFGLEAGRAELELPASYRSDLGHFKLHPALMDMATGFITLQHGLADSLPFGYGEIVIHRPLTQKLVSYASLRERSADGVACEVTICDELGDVLVEVRDYRLKVAGGEGHVAGGEAENFQVTIGTPGLLDTLNNIDSTNRGENHNRLMF